MRGKFLSLLTVAFALSASAEVVFEKDIYPIFKDNCSGCHFPGLTSLKAKLDLSTLGTTLAGGESGPTVLVGKPDESPFVQMLEWKLEPHMPPPKKGEQLKPDQIALVKQWIAEGAKGGAPVATAAVAESKPAPSAPATAVASRPAAITAIAYGMLGDELLLARGGLHVVDVFSVNRQTGALAPRFALEGHAEAVRALAFSPDGSLIAAAGGLPGRAGEVKLWSTADGKPVRTIDGHADNILDVAFSPDGAQLATCSYDKLAIIWNVATGEKLQTLKNHVDAVYSLAYSPDGAKLVTGAGDRTVKIWDTTSGKLITTLSESLDIIYSVAFSPTGDKIAGAGGDKYIRIWSSDQGGGELKQNRASAGQLLKASFAHDGAVIGIAFSPDGKTLYSTSEDRRIKAWDADTLSEKLVFERQPDWVTALAVDPSGTLLAAGRYDSTSALYSTSTGKPFSQDDTTTLAKADEQPVADSSRKKVTSLAVEAVVIRATIPASLSSASPAMSSRGAELEVTINGKNLDKGVPIASSPALKTELISLEAGAEPNMKLGEGPRGTGADIFDNARPYTAKLKVTVAPDAPLGVHELFMRTPLGTTNGVAFTVVARPDLGEAEPNNAVAEAQVITAPTIIAAAIQAAGDVDRYKVHAKAGEELVFAITDSGLNAALRLLDGADKQLATNELRPGKREPRLGYRFEADGDYVLEVADNDLRENIGYRLHVGPFPYVTSFWPMGIPAGAPQQVAVTGFNIGGTTTLTVDPPDAASNGTVAGLPVAGFEGSPIALPVLDVTQFPEVAEDATNTAPAQAQVLPVPAVVNGHVASENEADYYAFTATKDQTILIEVKAARLSSDLDSMIEVVNRAGEPLERGVIRAVAETFVTLSPRDSRSAGIRLDNWDLFNMGDYVMVGSEIIKANRLPDYGDEDVVFASYPSGQRMALFGTTPEAHAVYTKVYKVEVAPPGTTFPPNGLPIYPLYWRNDDGFFGNGDGSGDSILEFTAPADGEYVVKLTDTMGRGGEGFGYRLKLRSKEPSFFLSAGPYRTNIAPNSRVPLDVRVLRQEGFDEALRVSVVGLPEGFTCEPDTILPGEDLVRLALVSGPTAKTTAWDFSYKVVAETVLNGAPVTREAGLGPITVTEPQPDIRVANGENRVAIAPGTSGWVSVRLDRANGFTSRVPIEVLNLPYGVRVLDTGLNGILVREGETDRKMEIYVEPWVKPMDRKIYIQALIEAQSPMKPTFLGEPIELAIGDTTTTASAK